MIRYAGARDDALECVAFRHLHGVGTEPPVVREPDED
jgi:hypothetical protein